MNTLKWTCTVEESGVRFDFSDNNYNYIVVPFEELTTAMSRIQKFITRESNDLIFSDIAHFIKK